MTEVIPYNQARIKQAIARELAREGQIYFVHNRVHDIISVADTVQQLAGEKARVVWGHGQMNPHELEEVMLKFMRREADILVSTTIIESGIDIATANTMIINDADRFGLSDLHQLRGRVGRSKHRAYCYLLLPDDRVIKDTAKKRLKALEQYSMLGAGFKIAMRDLEIRGAGNILGPEQSGHIAAVGYDMYCRLLEQAAHELKNEKRDEPASSTSVEVGISGLLPKAYIPSDQRRLGAYRRIATATTQEQLAQARTDLVDAYGPLPSPAQRLFDIAELRLALSKHDVRGVTIREKDVVFLCKHEQQVADVLGRNASSAAASQASIRALPPTSPGALGEVYFRPPESYMEPATLLAVLRRRLGIVEAPPASAQQNAPAAPPQGGLKNHPQTTAAAGDAGEKGVTAPGVATRLRRRRRDPAAHRETPNVQHGCTTGRTPHTTPGLDGAEDRAHQAPSGARRHHGRVDAGECAGRHVEARCRCRAVRPARRRPGGQ